MAESHKVDVFRSSKSSERRRATALWPSPTSSVIKRIENRSSHQNAIAMSVRLAARTQTPRTQPPAASLGRQWPTIALAASGRPLRWRAPLGTYVAPSHGSVRSRRLRRARYCGVLRRIAAYCLLQYAPALDASDEPAGAADGADKPDAPGLLLRLNPGKLSILLLSTRTKTAAIAAAATTTRNRGQLS